MKRAKALAEEKARKKASEKDAGKGDEVDTVLRQIDLKFKELLEEND